MEKLIELLDDPAKCDVTGANSRQIIDSENDLHTVIAPQTPHRSRGRRSGELGMPGPWPGWTEKTGTGGSWWADFAGIEANVLFGKALELGSGWKVVKSEMDVAGRVLAWVPSGPQRA